MSPGSAAVPQPAEFGQLHIEGRLGIAEAAGPQQAGRARAADRVLADAGDQVRAGVGARVVKPVEARPAEHDTEQFAVAGRIPAAQGYLP